MAHNNFNHEDILTPDQLLGLVGKVVTDTIAWIFFVASVLAMLFGIISWSALNKFRTLRNFALLSAIITYMLLALVMQLSNLLRTEEDVKNNRNTAIEMIPLVLYVFFQMVYQFWLLVLCYIFCVDFVQVFHYDIRYKYIFSNLFAWGVPFITVLVYVIIGSVLINRPGDDSKDIFVSSTALNLLFIPVALSVITYIAVVCRLFCSASTNKKCKGFTIITSIFAISNVFLFAMVPAVVSEKNISALNIIGQILEYALIIALFVLIVILKSNWKLWRDFISKRVGPEFGVMVRRGQRRESD